MIWVYSDQEADELLDIALMQLQMYTKLAQSALALSERLGSD